MKTQKKADELVTFLYRAGLFWFNIYVFVKMSSLAMNFAKIWSNSYKTIINHSLIFLFGLGFFVIFGNLSQIAISIEEKDTDALLKSFRKIASTSVLLLFVLLFAQIYV